MPQTLNSVLELALLLVNYVWVAYSFALLVMVVLGIPLVLAMGAGASVGRAAEGHFWLILIAYVLVLWGLYVWAWDHRATIWQWWKYLTAVLFAVMAVLSVTFIQLSKRKRS